MKEEDKLRIELATLKWHFEWVLLWISYWDIPDGLKKKIEEVKEKIKSEY
jgi:hypothetical protein